MKCNCSKEVLWLIMGVVMMAMPQPVNGQFFKKLKKQAEEKIIKKADKKVDDILNGNKDAEQGPSTQTGGTTQTGK
ncbi:MAG: hypothetical protein VX772_11735, partial [Bacteroidota bacterium]|nr:hypothetical protein [Bacteroidota bacterium]